MIEEVDVRDNVTLADYEQYAQFTVKVRELKQVAAAHVPHLTGRRVWMVNSTSRGGGVAEMMPRLITIFRELGVDARWAVIGADSQDFFGFTKNLHNLIHGAGTATITERDREAYVAVNRENFESFRKLLAPNDVVVIHDPQPMGMGAMIKKTLGNPTVWRCHIGLDDHTEETRTAWYFLEHFANAYDHGVFTAPEYIPSFFAGKASIIHPAIDPTDHKNRSLAVHKISGILHNAELLSTVQPVLTEAFEDPALRLQPDGSYLPANQPEQIGLLYRPIITQISRWDKLKGFQPLLEGFARMKRDITTYANGDERHKRRLEIMRLVLAGPDPGSIQDDPEGLETLGQIEATYRALPPEIQRDIAVLTLPMKSRKINALIVNALQRCATVVVQNSLQEGFGLTATEAMWKAKPVLVSKACGLRQQVRDGLEGQILRRPKHPEFLALALNSMMQKPWQRGEEGRNAQRRVFDAFLIFTQVARWLEVLHNTVLKVNGNGAK
ncbi:MAG: glycosyltransferase [Acidobacteriota bacterium]|nr:glycosyltransferase [Acidobacteriota bacterium]